MAERVALSAVAVSVALLCVGLAAGSDMNGSQATSMCQ